MDGGWGLEKCVCAVGKAQGDRPREAQPARQRVFLKFSDSLAPAGLENWLYSSAGNYLHGKGWLEMPLLWPDFTTDGGCFFGNTDFPLLSQSRSGAWTVIGVWKSASARWAEPRVIAHARRSLRASEFF